MKAKAKVAIETLVKKQKEATVQNAMLIVLPLKLLRERLEQMAHHQATQPKDDATKAAQPRDYAAIVAQPRGYAAIVAQPRDDNAARRTQPGDDVARRSPG